MHNNKMWRWFLLMIAAATIGYTAMTGYKYYQFSRLDAQAPAQNMKWHVAEHASDDYTLVADYTFNVNGVAYSGSTDFRNDVFLNEMAADGSIAEKGKRPWRVYYDKNHPEYSALEKDFPFKSYIYTIVLWGILLYFILLGFYISKKMN